MKRIPHHPRRHTRHLIASCVLLIGCLLLIGCAPKTYYLNTKYLKERQSSSSRILLMPPDVELSIKTAGGFLQPHAEWTKKATVNVKIALEKALRGKLSDVLHYAPPPKDSLEEHEHLQIIKLHAAVGNAIHTHKYIPKFKLPAKREKFDWSLGRNLSSLRNQYDADYVLFLHFRDSYASGGRIAVIIAVAVLTAGNVAIKGGEQAGFASLVDLRTGEIVWFNRLVRGTGELRESGPALESVKTLLVAIPL